MATSCRSPSSSRGCGRSALARGNSRPSPAKDLEPFSDAARWWWTPMSIARSQDRRHDRQPRRARARTILAFAAGLDKSKGSFWNLYPPGSDVPRSGHQGDTSATRRSIWGMPRFSRSERSRPCASLRADQEVGNGDRLTVMPPNCRAALCTACAGAKRCAARSSPAPRLRCPRSARCRWSS